MGQRILVLGANGQLGSDLLRAPRPRGCELSGATREDFDLTAPASLDRLFAERRPGLVINTVAYNNVNTAETDAAAAFAVNAVAAAEVARAARAAGAGLIHISTDYVFDGASRRPYFEADARRAVNVYGASKLAGEDLVRNAHPGAAIVRVAALFGVAGASGKGGNFVETMLRLARAGGPIRVVADQVTGPTNTADLAERLIQLAGDGPAEGVFHLAPSDSCSWYEFAAAIFDDAGVAADLSSTTAAEYASAVARPAYSVLASERLAPLRPWRDGLRSYLTEKGYR